MATITERRIAEDAIIRTYAALEQIQTQAAATLNLMEGISVDAASAAIQDTSTTLPDLAALKQKFNVIASM